MAGHLRGLMAEAPEEVKSFLIKAHPELEEPLPREVPDTQTKAKLARAEDEARKRLGRAKVVLEKKWEEFWAARERVEKEQEAFDEAAKAFESFTSAQLQKTGPGTQQNPANTFLQLIGVPSAARDGLNDREDFARIMGQFNDAAAALRKFAAIAISQSSCPASAQATQVPADDCMGTDENLEAASDGKGGAEPPDKKAKTGDMAPGRMDAKDLMHKTKEELDLRLRHTAAAATAVKAQSG